LAHHDEQAGFRVEIQLPLQLRGVHPQQGINDPMPTITASLLAHLLEDFSRGVKVVEAEAVGAVSVVVKRTGSEIILIFHRSAPLVLVRPHLALMPTRLAARLRLNGRRLPLLRVRLNRLPAAERVILAPALRAAPPCRHHRRRLTLFPLFQAWY